MANWSSDENHETELDSLVCTASNNQQASRVFLGLGQSSANYSTATLPREDTRVQMPIQRTKAQNILPRHADAIYSVSAKFAMTAIRVSIILAEAKATSRIKMRNSILIVIQAFTHTQLAAQARNQAVSSSSEESAPVEFVPFVLSQNIKLRVEALAIAGNFRLQTHPKRLSC